MTNQRMTPPTSKTDDRIEWERPQDCPRWDTCNAPLCPLDQDTGSHLKGEQVCYQLRAAKYGHCTQPAIVSVLQQLQGTAPITHKRLASESRSISLSVLAASLGRASDPCRPKAQSSLANLRPRTTK